MSGHNFENIRVDVGHTNIWERNSETILGIQIERNLKFDKHVVKLCKSSVRKLSAITRLTNI